MVGEDFRLRNFYPQAWARLFFLPEKSPNKSELIPIPYGAHCLGLAVVTVSIAFLVCPLAQNLFGGSIRCFGSLGAMSESGPAKCRNEPLFLPRKKENPTRQIRAVINEGCDEKEGKFISVKHKVCRDHMGRASRICASKSRKTFSSLCSVSCRRRSPILERALVRYACWPPANIAAPPMLWD